MIKNIFSTAILVGFSLAAAPIVAKDLYVDAANGDDSVSYAANGPSNPWASIGRAVWGSTSLNNPNGSQAAAAGDTVIVQAGTYSTTQGTNERYLPIYNPVNSGTAGNPITIRAEGLVVLEANTGGGQPIVGTTGRQHIVWSGFYIDEANVDTTADTGPVVVWDSNNVTIEGFTIIGFNRGWADNHNAIRLESVDNVIIRNNTIRGYSESQNGMNASAITTYRTGAARIENNEISDANTGIFVKGLNTGPFVIRYNKISGVNAAIQFGGIGTSQGSNGAIAYSNVVFDAWAGVSFIGYDSVSPSNVTVANNTFVNIRGADGAAILFRPNSNGYNNLNAYNNLVANSDFAVAAWHNDLEDTSLAHNNYANVGTVASINWTNYNLLNWQTSFGKDVVGTATNGVSFVDAAAGDFHLQDSPSLLTLGRDYLDLDNDGSALDSISVGAYALGTETIGLTTTPAAPPPAAAKTPSPPSLQ